MSRVLVQTGARMKRFDWSRKDTISRAMIAIFCAKPINEKAIDFYEVCFNLICYGRGKDRILASQLGSYVFHADTRDS